MPGTVSSKHAISPFPSPGLQQAGIHATAVQWSDLKGFLAHTGENRAGQATFDKNLLLPPPARPPAARPPLRRRARLELRLVLRRLFSPGAPCIHVGWCRRGRSGLASVFVFAAAALVHCARRGYGILFLFLAASQLGAEPAVVDCALQRCSHSPIISVENADIRSSAC